MVTALRPFQFFSNALTAGVRLARRATPNEISNYCDDIYGFGSEDTPQSTKRVHDNYKAVGQAGEILNLPMKPAKNVPPNPFPVILGFEWDLVGGVARPKPEKLVILKEFVKKVEADGWRASVKDLESFIGKPIFYRQIASRGGPH